MSNKNQFYEEITPKPYRPPHDARQVASGKNQTASQSTSSNVPSSARAGDGAFDAGGASGGARRAPESPRPYAKHAIFAILVVGLLAYSLIQKVDIAVTPENASAQVLGLPMVEFGNAYYALPGEYELVLSAPAYRPMIGRITVAFGAENRFAFEMEKLPGHLEVVVTPVNDATVYLDGQNKGAAPITINDLPPKQYTVGARSAGYEATTEVVVIEGLDKTQTLTLTLVPESATVHLKTSPDGATVAVGEQVIGVTPMTHRLNANEPHTLSLSKAGYQSAVRTMRLKRNEQKRMDVSLKPVNAKPPAKKQDAPPTTQKKRAPSPTQSRASVEAKLGLQFAVFKPRSQNVVFSRGRELYTAVLTRPFAIAKTETTNKQFKAFLASHSSGNFQSIDLDGDAQPVVNVSWTQAALYANWVSEQAGVAPFYTVHQNKVVGFNRKAVGYRLVSEAEWMSALQKVRPARYMWGNAFDRVPKKSGNYADISAAKTLTLTHTLERYDDEYPVSAPVGSFYKNSRGVYDLEGNVAEWLHDVFTVIPVDERMDPLGPQLGANHVIRGGSWKYGSRRMLSAAYRQYHDDRGKPEVGFRLAYYLQ